MKDGTTIVRGVLFLPPSSLLDISGREILDLKPGANDVGGLRPGVYFVCEASGVKRGASGVTKVVLTM